MQITVECHPGLKSAALLTADPSTSPGFPMTVQYELSAGRWHTLRAIAEDSPMTTDELRVIFGTTLGAETSDPLQLIGSAAAQAFGGIIA